jgi:hypothetical protein
MIAISELLTCTDRCGANAKIQDLTLDMTLDSLRDRFQCLSVCPNPVRARPLVQPVPADYQKSSSGSSVPLQ